MAAFVRGQNADSFVSRDTCSPDHLDSIEFFAYSLPMAREKKGRAICSYIMPNLSRAWNIVRAIRRKWKMIALLWIRHFLQLTGDFVPAKFDRKIASRERDELWKMHEKRRNFQCKSCRICIWIVRPIHRCSWIFGGSRKTCGSKNGFFGSMNSFLPWGIQEVFYPLFGDKKPQFCTCGINKKKTAFGPLLYNML